MVDLVIDNLTAINKLLAGSTGVLGVVPPLMSYSGMFGDMAVQSAWSEFHQAWVRETGVTSSAIVELRKLLPDAAAKYEGADLDGGRAVSGVDTVTPGSGVSPADPLPILSLLKSDLSNSSGLDVPEPNATTQNPKAWVVR
ncbi:hypothetical protein OH799_12950 [Nocardia sp. NBC_00881]|uniref:hypothetical protein n=1 Tax=Nocardia sp. NBC_00881 TaxID=2975995 RepID=UPI00386B9D0C|nr:hypothetical protein OH799_12950 [Nocardia sp. NBC_00881]